MKRPRRDGANGEALAQALPASGQPDRADARMTAAVLIATFAF